MAESCCCSGIFAILISPHIDPQNIAPSGSASPHGQAVPASFVARKSAVEISWHSVAHVAPDLPASGIPFPGPYSLRLVVVRENAGAPPEEDRSRIGCPHPVISCPDLQA